MTFTIAPSNTSWNTEPWNDDATSGLDPSFLYTHAYNFGSAPRTTINGVAFVGVAGTNPTVPERFTSNGLTGIIDDDAKQCHGESRILANSFVYTLDTTIGTLTLEGLVPGRQYELTIFSANWDGAGTRWATFRAGSDQQAFDQDRLRRQQRHPLHLPLHRARRRHPDDPHPSDPECLDPLVRHRQSRSRGRERPGHLE